VSKPTNSIPLLPIDISEEIVESNAPSVVSKSNSPSVVSKSTSPSPVPKKKRGNQGKTRGMKYKEREPLIPTANVVVALVKFKGRITQAADYLKINYRTLVRIIEKRPEIMDAIEEARERKLDEAEEALDEMVSKGDQSRLGAVCFTLKCLGKDRGYVEKMEHTLSGKDGGPLVVEIKNYAPKGDK